MTEYATEDQGRLSVADVQGVVQYSFLASKLALTWRDGEGMGTLLFAPAQPSDAAVPGG